MYGLDGTLLHTAQFIGIQLSFAPHLRRSVTKHFTNCGVKVGKVACYPLECIDNISFIVEPAKQTKILARVIMGLFKRKGIEIDMHCIASSNFDTYTVKFTLHSASDVRICEKLLSRCSAIHIRYKN